MTAIISSELMRAMGFHPFAPGEALTAEFTSVSVYEARGIALSPGSPVVTTGVIGDVHYRVALGLALNDTCARLANDSYVDNEEDWMKDRNTSGPFVLIQVGPTRPYTITTGQIKEEKDGSATTFDSFPGLRAELYALEATALPPLLTALSCTLADSDCNLDLRKLDRASVGRTPEGQTIRDIRLQFSAAAHVSHAVEPDALSYRLQEATGLAPRLNSKAARFFALGLGEDDDLKRFLYFFLALEVETHAAFARIDHAKALAKLLDPTSPPQASAVALLQRQADQLRNLFDRFVWCAACAWSGVTDAAVAQFKALTVSGRATRSPTARYLNHRPDTPALLSTLPARCFAHE